MEDTIITSWMNTKGRYTAVRSDGNTYSVWNGEEMLVGDMTANEVINYIARGKDDEYSGMIDTDAAGLILKKRMLAIGINGRVFAEENGDRIRVLLPNKDEAEKVKTLCERGAGLSSEFMGNTLVIRVGQAWPTNPKRTFEYSDPSGEIII